MRMSSCPTIFDAIAMGTFPSTIVWDKEAAERLRADWPANNLSACLVKDEPQASLGNLARVPPVIPAAEDGLG